MDPPFITLAAGGMQPAASPPPQCSSLSGNSSERDSSAESSLSSIGSELHNGGTGASSTSTVPMPTHDTSRTKYHMNELSTFAARLEHAAASIFPNKGRSRYKGIRVLLLRWEEDPMGVQYELDDLAKTFESSYGYETETWVIPTIKSHFALMGKAD